MSNAKRWGLILGAVGVVAVMLAFWLGRPAYRRHRENRALAQVRENLTKGDFRAAQLGLQQVLRWNSANVEAVWLGSEMSAAAQSPDALGWRQRLVELDPSFNNKLRLADTALRMERFPYPTASATLAELQRSGGETNAAFHVVAWQLAAARHQSVEAEKHLQAIVRYDPTNRLHQVNLAAVHLQSPDKAVVAAAHRELVAMAADPTLGPAALRALVQEALSERRYDDVDRFSVQLLALPGAQFADRLQRLNGLYESRSKQLTPVLADVKKVAATNAFLAAGTAGWMIPRGMAAEALSWLNSLPPDMAATPPLPVVKADCYGELRDWPGLEQFLSKQNWNEKEYHRLALLTRSLREQNRRQIASAQWQRAVVAANNRQTSLMHLAQMAAAWGWTSESDELRWTVVRRSPWLEAMWAQLAQSRQNVGDTPGLYRVYRAQWEALPEQLPSKNNVAIIGLLLKTNMDLSLRLAHEVYQAQPTNAIYASTYAFALHRQGKSAEGLKLLESLPEAKDRRPDIAAYQAILLSAVGKTEQAKPYIASAERVKETLLPEERRLLAEAGGGK